MTICNLKWLPKGLRTWQCKDPRRLPETSGRAASAVIALVLFLLPLFPVGCSRDSDTPDESAKPDSGPQPPATGKQSSASEAAGNAKPDTPAEAPAPGPKSLVQRWIDIDLPMNEGPPLPDETGASFPETAFARIRLAETQEWRFAVSGTRTFPENAREVALGSTGDAAKGGSTGGKLSPGDEAMTRAVVEKILTHLRGAVSARKNTQTVNLDFFGRRNLSSRNHIAETAPMGLVAAVADAVGAIRRERAQRGDNTPLRLVFSNTEAGLGEPKAGESTQPAPDGTATPPDVELPILCHSHSSEVRDPGARDTCSLHIYHPTPENLTADGWRIQVGGAVAANPAPVRDLAALLASAAKASPAGHNEDRLSNMRLLIHADPRTPSHYLGVVLTACMDPQVRVYRLSLGAVGVDESAGK